MLTLADTPDHHCQDIIEDHNKPHQGSHQKGCTPLLMSMRPDQMLLEQTAEKVKMASPYLSLDKWSLFAKQEAENLLPPEKRQMSAYRLNTSPVSMLLQQQQQQQQQNVEQDVKQHARKMAAPCGVLSTSGVGHLSHIANVDPITLVPTAATFVSTAMATSATTTTTATKITAIITPIQEEIRPLSLAIQPTQLTEWPKHMTAATIQTASSTTTRQTARTTILESMSKERSEAGISVGRVSVTKVTASLSTGRQPPSLVPQHLCNDLQYSKSHHRLPLSLTTDISKDLTATTALTTMARKSTIKYQQQEEQEEEESRESPDYQQHCVKMSSDASDKGMRMAKTRLSTSVENVCSNRNTHVTSELNGRKCPSMLSLSPSLLSLSLMGLHGRNTIKSTATAAAYGCLKLPYRLTKLHSNTLRQSDRMFRFVIVYLFSIMFIMTMQFQNVFGKYQNIDFYVYNLFFHPNIKLLLRMIY